MKELLSVRTNLSPSSRSDETLNLLPVLSVYLQTYVELWLTFNELNVFCLSPSSSRFAQESCFRCLRIAAERATRKLRLAALELLGRGASALPRVPCLSSRARATGSRYAY